MRSSGRWAIQIAGGVVLLLMAGCGGSDADEAPAAETSTPSASPSPSEEASYSLLLFDTQQCVAEMGTYATVRDMSILVTLL